MKKVTKLMMVAVFASLFCSCDARKSFTLSGKIDGTVATEAYLMIEKEVDTVAVEDGTFTFKGSVEEPTMGVLMLENRQVQIMLENAPMTIAGAIDALVESEITGSASQLVFDEFIKNVGQHNITQQAYIDYCTDFIERNTESYFTPYLIANLASLIKAEEVGGMLENLSPEVQSGKIASEIAKHIAPALSVAVGRVAPDFTMNDVNGNPVTLSDLYAKSTYLLIDFWASWCGPCRRENPNVVANFKKYKEKGFDVIGVSLDEKQEAWEKAIAADSLAWTNVSDLQKWKNAAAALYSVRGIPANFLVDSKGKIVASNLKGEALGAKLSELLD